jgi:hypothetical protein
MISLYVPGKGGYMQHDRILLTDNGKTPASQPEIDRSPRTYTFREQLIVGLKLAFVVGIIVLFFWVFEKINPF